MSTIIAATDFTEIAENAVHYACQLALAQNAEVLVMHVYSVPVSFSDVPIPSPIFDIEKNAEDSMRTLLDRLFSAYPQLSISSNISMGNVVDIIDEYAQLHEAPMLVIAGNAYNPERTTWFDSELMDMLKNVKYPILAVPANTKYSLIKKIGFAYDNVYEGSDMALIELRELSIKLGAELHVFHAKHDVGKTEKETEINEHAKLILSNANPLYHVYYESDIDTSIQGFADKYNIDWLVIMPRKHNLFNRLFHASHTELMVNHSYIPLLALHHN